MKTLSRRRFLGAAGGLVGIASMALKGRSQGVLGSNERINIALIGCGGRGMGLIGGFMERKDVRVAGLCDIHPERLSGAARGVGARQTGPEPKRLTRIDQVLEDRDVDAVVIATPDHWHTPAALRACQAGKDVYVEKPFCHNVWEGRQLVQAARKYGRVVQIGTQNRSGAYNLAAKAYIDSGALGDIRLVKVYNCKGGGPFRLGDPGEKTYHQRIFGGGWHQFWDFSGGDLADDGIHQLDLALMLMGDPAAPGSVSASGGRMQFKDDREVPDVEILQYEYPGFVLTFELTQYANAMNKIAGEIRGGDAFPNWLQCATRIEFYGSKEFLVLGRHGGGWQAFNSAGKVSSEHFGRHPDPEHKQNFVECLRSRKRPNSDVERCLQSHTVMHIGNIAHRIGNRQLRFDSATEEFIGNAEANQLLRRANQNRYSVPEVV
jgi:predicted dehydrogenase